MFELMALSSSFGGLRMGALDRASVKSWSVTNLSFVTAMECKGVLGSSPLCLENLPRLALSETFLGDLFPCRCLEQLTEELL